MVITKLLVVITFESTKTCEMNSKKKEKERQEQGLSVSFKVKAFLYPTNLKPTNFLSIKLTTYYLLHNYCGLLSLFS